jgi:hypothetical protein
LEGVAVGLFVRYRCGRPYVRGIPLQFTLV